MEKNKKKSLNRTKPKENDMGYYCKLCKCFHNTGSEIWSKHRIYASKTKYKRTKRDFWDRFFFG